MKHDVLLETKDLKMHFPIEDGIIFKRKVGAIRAVDGVDLTLRKGETLGVVGESGCGKSTTARAISQLYQPTSGEVIFEGTDLTKLSQFELLKTRRQIQMVFQDPYASLNPRMVVNDIIREPLDIYRNRRLLDMDRKEMEAKVENLMERVGLSRYFKNRYPHEFSGGQRQRIGIARSLALNPRVILADEPVSALDVSIQAQILNLFLELQEEFDLTYMFIAHDLSVIEYVSNRVAVMYLGKVVEIADSKSLYKQPLHPYTKALFSAAPIPDPKVERTRKRIVLEGDVPSPDQERFGCYFYDRCPHRMDVCKKNVPELLEVDTDHKVACYLYFTQEQKSRLN